MRLIEPAGHALTWLSAGLLCVRRQATCRCPTGKTVERHPARFRYAASIPMIQIAKNGVREKINFTRQFKFFDGVTPGAIKILLPFYGNGVISLASRPIRGAFRERHDSLVRAAMGAVESQDVRRDRVRSSRVVLSPRRWGQVAQKKSAATEANKPGTPGRSRSSRSNHCAGSAGSFRPYLTILCAFCCFCTQACGCGQRPAFPAPSAKEGRE
jgi:hypothetical protein